MDDMNIAGGYDAAELTFWAFTLFFLGLLVYLRREDRREGYPLEDEVTGRVDTPAGVLANAGPKHFLLPFGRGTVSTPTKGREPVDVAGTRTFRSPGAPYHPTGNPLTSKLGPAAYAERADVPDLDAEGRNRVVPIGLTTHIAVDYRDTDPRGLTVIGADGAVAGTVTDIWVDRAEHQIRFLEIDTGTNRVLAPMGMAKVRGRAGQVVVDAINAADFAAAPVPKTAGQISFLEEEKIYGYFGGGYLYANAARQEPIL